MIIKNIVISIFLLFCAIGLDAQDLEFYREDINFEIRDGYFMVDGIYYFSNPGDKAVRKILMYPFPVNDSLYGEVDSVSIKEMKDSLINQIKGLNKNAALFSVNLAAYETTKYHIQYRQKLLKDQAEYILLTTQEWGKPFEQVSYTLSIPADLKISFSIPPDSIRNQSGKKLYLWDKKDFMPQQNMLFWFR